MTILTAGEILWDVFDNGEHLGGATFNFAAHARRLGHEVRFISAVGDDERGRRALRRMRELGLSTQWIRTATEAGTGIVTVKLEAGGQPHFTIHRPAAYDFAELSNPAACRPDWIYFGTLYQMNARSKDLVRRILEAHPAALHFYDVNLRVDSYTPALVEELMGCADVVKLNDAEVEAVREMLGGARGGLEAFARDYAKRFGWRAACITRGAEGCALLIGDEYVVSPGYPVKVADTVGAGDAFAAAFLHGFHAGWPPAEVADFANRVGALVASREGGVPPWTVEECRALRRSRQIPG
jgi:fructokinase